MKKQLLPEERARPPDALGVAIEGPSPALPEGEDELKFGKMSLTKMSERL